LSGCLDLVQLRNAEWKVGRKYVDNIGCLQAIFLHFPPDKNSETLTTEQYVTPERRVNLIIPQAARNPKTIVGYFTIIQNL
jgi:hypothetical protein